MCKYCEFTNVNDRIGEKINDEAVITQIREGRHSFELYMRRYQTSDGYEENELILEESFKITDVPDHVTSKHVKIKYCPFCGEKL